MTWMRFKSKYVSLRWLGTLGWSIFRYVVLLGISFIILYPFALKVAQMFMSRDDLLDNTVRFIPIAPTFDNIIASMNAMQYTRALLYTMMFCIVISLLQIIVCSLAGYGFARFKFYGKNIIFFLVIMTLIVPTQVIIIPMFLSLRFFLGTEISLINSIWSGIILTATGMGLRSGLYIFLFRQYFKNMPRELEEAAYVDGYGVFSTFYRIIIPTSGTVITMIFLLSFAWQWTDTYMSTVFMSGEFLLASRAPLGIPLTGFQINTVEVFNMFLNTSAILAIMPLAVIYFVCQRFFIQSVARTGLTE